MVNEDTQFWIQAPADSTGKKIDTRYFTTTAGTVVHREVMHIGGTAIGQILLVTSGGAYVYVPGFIRVQSATAASFLNQASAKDGSLTALYRQFPSLPGQYSAASSVGVVLAPRFVMVESVTAASFKATIQNEDSGGSKINVTQYQQLPDRLGQLTRASSLSVTLSTNAVVQAILPGFARVQSATQASFLVSHPGYIRAQSSTYASFLAQTAAIAFGGANLPVYSQFPITPGQKTRASSLSVTLSTNAVVQAILPGYARVTSNSSASFAVAVPGIVDVQSLTAASFLTASLNLATARSTWPTAEANNTTGTAIMDLSRRLVVLNQTFPEKTQSTVVTVTTTVPIALFGATASERNYISTLMGSNSSATATRVDFFDRTTAGRKYASAYIAASGGGFALPISDVDIRGNTNSTVVVRCTPTVTSVLVTAIGYSAP